jgi:hypothetical protein
MTPCRISEMEMGAGLLVLSSSVHLPCSITAISTLHGHVPAEVRAEACCLANGPSVVGPW